MSDYPVVGYEKKKHEASYFRFLEKVLGPEKFAVRKKAVLWLHDGHPLVKRAPLRFVVTDGERIAGSMGHMPADYIIRGKRVPVRITHDLLVDPDYRGQGIAKKLVDNARSTGEFFPGGMWMNVPCYKIHETCGFADVLPVATQTLVLDAKAFVDRQKLGGAKGAAVRAALGVARMRAMRRVSAARKGSAGETLLREISEFDPALDGPWLSMLETYGIAACRDAAFLNWKYARHPVVKYRMLFAERRGKPGGYLVWRLPLEGGGENRAVIVDYVVERGDVAAFQSMVAAVVLEASTARVESVSVMTTQPWAEKLLRSFGFLPRRQSHTWLIANWEGHIPAEWLRSREPWHVCLGDSDGDFWTGGQ